MSSKRKSTMINACKSNSSNRLTNDSLTIKVGAAVLQHLEVMEKHLNQV